MFKLIFLVVGFVLGGAAGIWFSVSNPELASKVAAKQDDLIAEGKRQAIEEIKKRLDQIVAKEEAPAAKPGIAGFIPGASSGGSSDTQELKALSAELGTKLNKLDSAKH